MRTTLAYVTAGALVAGVIALVVAGNLAAAVFAFGFYLVLGGASTLAFEPVARAATERALAQPTYRLRVASMQRSFGWWLLCYVAAYAIVMGVAAAMDYTGLGTVLIVVAVPGFFLLECYVWLWRLARTHSKDGDGH